MQLAYLNSFYQVFPPGECFLAHYPGTTPQSECHLPRQYRFADSQTADIEVIRARSTQKIEMSEDGRKESQQE